jgi:hypothetical protein
MNANPRYIEHGMGDFNPPDDSEREAAIERRTEALITEIDRDTSRVVELFLDEALSLSREKRGNGHIELIEIAVLSMDTWPLIEKISAGLPTTQEENKKFPALFRALRPWMEQRDVLVRQAASDRAEKELGV